VSRPLALIADDDADILLLLSLTLERDGYEVVAASDGVAAVDAARNRVPHLVVLDLMMPGLDGCEVTRRLRAEEATKDVPIMVVTAFSEDAQATRALEAGADAYMSKPFRPRDLLAKTASLVLERRPRSRLASHG
jgi:DNA-binding response OmpR family regulator